MNQMFQPPISDKNILKTLHRYTKYAEVRDTGDLLLEAREHLSRAHEMHAETGMVNVSVAEAIVALFEIVHQQWETIAAVARPWCKGMVAYFTAPDDDEADFNSPIGFDDDVEVVNACLKFAGRDDLCIELEDIKKSDGPQVIRQNIKSAVGKSGRSSLTPGQRVVCRDAEWLVTRVDITEHRKNPKTGNTELEHAVHCVGVDDLVRGHEAIFLTKLDDIVPVDPAQTKLIKDESTGYKLSKLFLGAQLRQMPATGIEPDLKGLGVFKPMKFQEEVVERALKQLRPRLLLADAVGLGKTIQVGMVLTELMRRGRANRVLVLAKKSMLTQFQAELWNRFNIPLVRLDSAGIAKLRLRIPANKNPFEVYHRIIVSIDTLKNVGRYEHFLKETRWDVVVIDEAHNVAGASVPERNLSYRLARQLSRRADSVLLTTATPHNGKRETFGRLISLLDPSVIPDPQFKEYTVEDIKQFYVMRFKEDVREDAGDLLTERNIVPLAHTTTDATVHEEEVYSILAELRKKVADTDPSGKKKGWQHHAMVQYVLYKLFLSSPEACLETVQKRLVEVRKQPDGPADEEAYLTKLGSSLERLDIRQSSRYQLLMQQLKEIGWTGQKSSPRVLIFTESPRTQRALAPALANDFSLKYSSKFEAQSGQALATINGSTPDIHLMKTVEAFATGSAPLRLMLATDVASEGINLHHECHHIIHYDLPWSIITLVQRNGRIDRLGQKMPPQLRYLIVNTQQGVLQGDKEIFERLVDKVEEINRLRKSGESVLQLYDPQAEEEYIAKKGIVEGDRGVLEKGGAESEADGLEDMLKMASQAGHDDFLDFLTGESSQEYLQEQAVDPQANLKETRIRLFSDREFLLKGYEFITGKKPDMHGNAIKITADSELKRRLGASDNKGDVIFGATAIPAESWPENGEFWLSDDPDRVNTAIEAARNTSGYWAKELLCSESHPILQWVTQRLVMQVRRGEAPYIISDKFDPGELCFCFIGQVSSVSGTPLLIDAHGISFQQGGKTKQHGLREVLKRINFEKMINTGAEPDLPAAELLLHSAVQESIGRMKMLLQKRENQLQPHLLAEERRLRAWSKKRRELLESQLAQVGETSKRARRVQQMLSEMEDYLQDRQQNWRDTHFTASRVPSTQLLLVIGGRE